MDRVEDYDFQLPDELIAQHPPQERDGGRLLHVGDEIGHRKIRDFVELVPDDAVIVMNNTRVIPARLWAHKNTGGRVEVLLIEHVGNCDWKALVRGKIRQGMTLDVANSLSIQIVEERDSHGLARVRFPENHRELVEHLGQVPLPPYMEREATDVDRLRYQTVFADESIPFERGSVAAPTAGLHLTDAILSKLEEKGCAVTHVELKVGLGTFAPIRVEEVAAHKMHREEYIVPPNTADLVNSGRPVVAVGTTVVRTLESATDESGYTRSGQGDTAIFIYPGYRFRKIGHLLTNFHLPRSTLFMLVCAFGGIEPMRRAYHEAIRSKYRFYSYGDAMFCSKRPVPCLT